MSILLGDAAIAAAVLSQQSEQHQLVIAELGTKHTLRQREHRRLHEAALSHSVHLFSEERRQVTTLFAARQSHKHHIAEREATRDLWQQRNETTQTIMIVGAVIAGCSYTLVVDGLHQWPLAVGSYRALPVIYAFFAALSVLLVLCGVVLCLHLYKRVSTFDMHRPLRVYPFCTSACRHRHKFFEDFYRIHCSGIEQAALESLFGAVASVLAGLIVYQVPKHLLILNDLPAAVIFAAVTLCGILWPVFGSIWWPLATVQTSPSPTHTEEGPEH